MSDGHRSGRSIRRVSCKSTESKRCSMMEMRYYYYYYYYYFIPQVVKIPVVENYKS